MAYVGSAGSGDGEEEGRRTLQPFQARHHAAPQYRPAPCCCSALPAHWDSHILYTLSPRGQTCLPVSFPVLTSRPEQDGRQHMPPLPRALRPPPQREFSPPWSERVKAKTRTKKRIGQC